MRRRSLLTDLALGAVAGAAATWVMDAVTTAMYEREPDEAKQKENQARGDRSAYEIAAAKAADAIGIDISDDERARAGTAMHWALGVGAGVAYGALRHAVPALGVGSGIAYGAAFFLAMDEAALTMLGITPPPDAFPWQTHARGLAGHLVLGGVLDAAFGAADAASTA